MEEENINFIISQSEKVFDYLNKDAIINAMNETYLLLNSCEYKDKEIENLKKELKKLFNNIKVMRVLRINQNIKLDPETSTEYYDEDIGTDKRLHFDEELENKINYLENEIRKVVSLIVKKELEDLDI